MEAHLVAIVEPGGEARGGGEKIDISGDEAGVDEVIGFLYFGIMEPGLRESLRMGEASDGDRQRR